MAVGDSPDRSKEPLACGAILPWRLFRIWAVIGAQSFGGGSATLYLIRRETVERQGWLTDDDFSRYWGICQIAPGINILGLVKPDRLAACRSARCAILSLWLAAAERRDYRRFDLDLRGHPGSAARSGGDCGFRRNYDDDNAAIRH